MSPLQTCSSCCVCCRSKREGKIRLSGGAGLPGGWGQRRWKTSPLLLLWLCLWANGQRCDGKHSRAVVCVGRGEVLRFEFQLSINDTNLGGTFPKTGRFLWDSCVFTHLIVGGWGPVADGAVLWWQVVLAVPGLPAGILHIQVRSVSGEGDDKYGRLTVLDRASPCLPLHLCLPVTVAHPAEAGAEQDAQAHPQDAEEDAGRGGGGWGWGRQRQMQLVLLLARCQDLLYSKCLSVLRSGCTFTALIHIAAPLALANAKGWYDNTNLSLEKRGKNGSDCTDGC